MGGHLYRWTCYQNTQLGSGAPSEHVMAYTVYRDLRAAKYLKYVAIQLAL